MKNIFCTICLFVGFICGFSSCEMKKELKGEGGDEDTPKGILDLSLTYVPETKVSDSDPKVDDFRVSVYDDKGELAVYYDTFHDFKSTELVLLPVGSYNVSCAWGDNKEAAFASPYFEGSKKCQINENEVTRTEVSADLQNVRVDLVLSADFLENYRDDYSVTLTNGKGVLVVGKNESRSAYFMPGTALKYTIKATTLDGKEALLSGVLKNESGGISGGDEFTIKVSSVPEIPETPVDPDNPDPSGPTQTGISIKVDVTLVNRDIEIVVPTTPAKPSEPESPTNTITIVGSGFDIDQIQEMTKAETKDATLDITLSASAGMEKIVVNIQSPTITDILGKNNPFDLLSLSPEMETLLGGMLSLPSKGDKSFTFKIGSFLPLLGVGDHKFLVTVTDLSGESLTKTLSIKITE